MEKDDNKQIKVSSWVLGILFILSAVVLVLFYGVGFDKTEFLNGKNLTAPQHTGTLILWMYALVVICIGAVLLFSLVSGFKSMRYRSIEKKKPVNEDVRKEGKVSYAAPVFLLMIAIIIMLVFIVMAAQFESLTLPFIIMFSIPFALSGVLIALALTGTSINLMSMLGAIMLIGIVVKNGIRTDYTARLLQQAATHLTTILTYVSSNLMRLC